MHEETLLTSTPPIETRVSRVRDITYGAAVGAAGAVCQHEELLNETSVTRAAAGRVAVPGRTLA